MEKGIGVSPGIAIGRAYVLKSDRDRIRKYSLLPEEIKGEGIRFREALDRSEEQLMDIKNQLSERRLADHVHIFDTHVLILHDRSLWKDIFQLMEERLINLEWALDIVRDKYSEIFSQIRDEVFREKKSDIHDVIDRIIDNLTGSDLCPADILPPNSVIFAHDLAPSLTCCLELANLNAFVTEVGGKTSHVAILARALSIPAVAGLGNILNTVRDGDSVIIDGSTGDVIIRPSRAISADYVRRQQREKSIEQELMKSKDLKAETIDGYRIELAANIELLLEIPAVHENGAEAVGLYRTEFLYMSTTTLPTEEEHFDVYWRLAQSMFPKKAVIRTLDAGGDKFISERTLAQDKKDFMGLRAIRLCLRRQDIFRTQLRAIIRANRLGNLKIMFPMISGLDELRQARSIYEEEVEALGREGLPENLMEIGIMIEVPSSAIIADVLAREVDFFSIGTNDLIQYALAINRINKEVAYLYEPLHPAILRTIQNVVQVAHNNGIWVGVCGEMAGDPFYAPILVGMGVDELSMTAGSIPKTKEVIRRISFTDARQLARDVLLFSEPDSIRKKVADYLIGIDPKFNDIVPD